MARVKGGYLGGVYDIPKKQPLDSRMLVTKRVDLINPSVWKTNGSTTGEYGHYNGMIVSVNSDGIYNGVYYLNDRNAITAENYEAYRTALSAGEDAEIYFSMWTKLGTLDDLATVKPAIGLKPVDGTIVIADTDNGVKSIGVAIAPVANNALTAVAGGLFVPVAEIKLEDNAHGLVMVDGELTLNLATKDSDGAMSKEDKRIIDALPATYATSKEVDVLKNTVATLEERFSWGDM